MLVPYPLNFCNKKQEIEVGTWVAGIARFRIGGQMAVDNFKIRQNWINEQTLHLKKELNFRKTDEAVYQVKQMSELCHY